VTLSPSRGSRSERLVEPKPRVATRGPFGPSRLIPIGEWRARGSWGRVVTVRCAPVGGGRPRSDPTLGHDLLEQRQAIAHAREADVREAVAQRPDDLLLRQHDGDAGVDVQLQLGLGAQRDLRPEGHDRLLLLGQGRARVDVAECEGDDVVEAVGVQLLSDSTRLA
jgi:hypothetical protein